jgi:intraflagellar transport protein 46
MILDTKMRPFIPNYVPAIGEVDAFMKISRPDNVAEELGLSALDEPTINGVDRAIFSLELSYRLKTKVNTNLNIKTLENADKNPKQIQTWIDQIGNLHKEKMSSNVSYSKQMPDVESLMQVWPDKMESILKDVPFPDDRLSIGTDNYAKIICSLLDIPIHKLNNNKGLIEALHVLFTTYLEFKENQHFNRANKDNNVQSIKFS